jgi:ADP-ribose pyrophosphatase
MDIKRLSSRVVYENRWMKVREDSIRRRDGSEGIFGVIEKADFVLVIPMDDDGFFLVEQFRYPVSARFCEFPQGSWEERPGVKPEEVARGELVEETGITAGSLEYLGHLYEAYGYSTQGFHVYLATELEHGQPQSSVEEQDLTTRHVAFDEFNRMVHNQEIKDAPTLAAFALLRLNE